MTLEGRQLEEAKATAKAMNNVWRPMVLFVAEEMGVDETLAVQYCRLAMDYRRAMAVEKAEMYAEEAPNRERAKELMERHMELLERDLGEDDDWRHG